MKKDAFNNIKIPRATLLPRLKPLDIFLLTLFGVFVLFFILVFSRSNEQIEIRVKVTDPNVLYMGLDPSNEFAYSFQKGDIERNEIGQQVAEIVDVERYKTTSISQSTYLTIKLKANYNPLQKRYSVKGRPIVFGQPIIFTFSNVKVEALIVEFPGYIQRKNKRTVFIRAQLRNDNRSFSDVYGVPEFLQNAVKKGDLIKDKDGQPIVEVISVRSEPAKRTVVSQDNRSITITDRELFDVFYELKVEAYEVDGKLFVYDYHPLELGGSLPMILDTFSLWPTVLDIQSDSSNEKNN